MFVCYQYNAAGMIVGEVITATPPHSVKNQLVIPAAEVFKTVVQVIDGVPVTQRIRTINLLGMTLRNGKLYDQQSRVVLGAAALINKAAARNTHIVPPTAQQDATAAQNAAVRAQATGERQEQVNELVRQGDELVFAEPVNTDELPKGKVKKR